MDQTRPDFLTELVYAHKACCPCISVQTFDEFRICNEIKTHFALQSYAPIKIGFWDSLNGLVWKVEDTEVSKTTDGLEVLKHLTRNPENDRIVILRDFHLQFSMSTKKADLIRAIKNIENSFKATRSMLVFISAIDSYPKELEKELIRLDYALPDETAILDRLNFIHTSVKKKANLPDIDQDIKDRIVEAAKGMTYYEIETAFSLAILKTKKFDKAFVNHVFESKIASLKKGGLLEYIPNDTGFENIGGLEELKMYIKSRASMFGERAKKFGLKLPKGILLCGCPGTGKTAIAKATAKEFGVPLFKLDLAGLFGRYVGDSEQNFIQVTKTIDAIGRCIILVDEIEKSMSNSAVSGETDGGTSSRTFGTWLTWMNDKKSPSYLIGTSNNHTILPDALKRKGRFDNMFWIDLPNNEELEQIYEVILTRIGRDPKKFDCALLADKSEGFTGSEIESLVNDALSVAFKEEADDITNAYIIDQIKETRPQSKVFSNSFNQMREEAKKTLSFASKTENEKIMEEFRKLELT